MITPVFWIAQDENFLLINIRAPYCKLRDAELSYEGHTFLFHASPYFLRLFLPAEVIDNETGSCDYDIDKGIFTVHVPKKVRGEYFPRLEMLSQLLIAPQQKQEPDAGRLIEDVNSGLGEEEGGYECYMDQKLPKNCDAEQPLASNSTFENAAPNEFGYGFGWTRHNILSRFRDEIGDLIDLENPDSTSTHQRADQLRDFDLQRFSAQHYLADLFSPDQGQLDAIAYCPFGNDELLCLNNEDLADLKDLRIYKLPSFPAKVSEQIALSLIDILFGYLYDFRTNLGEHNVESGWTISKLSPSLTFLVRWPSLRDALHCTARHSLVLPLYRNWKLTVQVLRDVCMVLDKGPVAILHCLLAIRRLFNRGDQFRYLFNQLLIDDLCLWIQALPTEPLILKLRTDFENELAKLEKTDFGEFDLEMIETEARLSALRPLDSDDEDK